MKAFASKVQSAAGQSLEPVRRLRLAAFPVRLLVGLFIVLPLLAYIGAGIFLYHQRRVESELKLDRALSVAREHAVKILQSNEVILDRMTEAMGSETAATLKSREAMLHGQFKSWSANIRENQSIWIWDAQGRPVASDRLFPVPENVSVADRPYFKWHQASRGGIFISEGAIGRATGTPFFDMSLGRYKADGTFDGVISTSLSPPYFESFYKELAGPDQGMSLMLIRSDGAILARWPPLPGDVTRLTPQGPIMRSISSGAENGTVEGLSLLDGRSRFFSFSKVGKYPVYLSAGMAQDTVIRDWLKQMGWLSLLVFPPMIGLYFAALMALRRTREALISADKLEEETATRMQVEGVLLQAQKLEALGRLTGGVAHDFNNALMVISTNLYLLRRKNPAIDHKGFDAIGRAVDTATKLTRQLLAFSRRQPLIPKSLSLQSWLPGAEDLIRPVLGSKIELVIRVDEGASFIWVDAAELELALINLAINARDAMPDGGKLQVSAFNAGSGLPAPLQGEMVVVEVSDTGVGIEPDILSKVFEPFFTTKPVGEGTGLGLSQIYGMCQRAGGSATVESQPGFGTTVRLFFPAVTETPQAHTAQSARLIKNLDKNVLLVEDNNDVASALIPVLEDMGCRLIRFDRAAAARDWLAAQTNLPDLLLSDVVMPGDIDGLGLAKHVRREYPAIKIVLMSGYAEQLESITDLGFEIIPKPCSADLLGETLQRAFAGSS